ncbi:MAG: hypothetical protein N3F07_03835 [Candidatus Micrarchaeota archaeon]|nr:hypothetical protein [Candidatus Micrarchaeota archaeon]
MRLAFPHLPAKYLLAFALAAAMASLLYFLAKPKPGFQGEIMLSVKPQLASEQQLVFIKAASSCGNFTLYLDGKPLASGERIEKQIVAEAGRHVVSANNSICGASSVLEVLKKECEEGEVAQCSKDGCPGESVCENGRLSECALPKKICVPGQKVGCPVDECRFGYMECNHCGTGFGPCLPKQEANCA